MIASERRFVYASRVNAAGSINANGSPLFCKQKENIIKDYKQHQTTETQVW